MTLTHHLPSALLHAQAWILKRPRLSLDGLWDFCMEQEDRWRVAKVPAPWQAQFDDLRYATGTALYRTRFTVPAGWSGQQVALCFGAVNYRAEVSLDGRALGVHEGGYLLSNSPSTIWQGSMSCRSGSFCPRAKPISILRPPFLRSRTANRAGTGHSAASGN